MNERAEKAAGHLAEEIPEVSHELALKIAESDWLGVCLNIAYEQGIAKGLEVVGAPPQVAQLILALLRVGEPEQEGRWQLDLDYVREEAPESAEAFAERFDLTAETVTENGPAGGAAVVRFTGRRDDLAEAVWDYAAGDQENAQFYMDQATLVEEPVDA